jgi:hypothetical protein
MAEAARDNADTKEQITIPLVTPAGMAQTARDNGNAKSKLHTSQIRACLCGPIMFLASQVSPYQPKRIASKLKWLGQVKMSSSGRMRLFEAHRGTSSARGRDR